MKIFNHDDLYITTLIFNMARRNVKSIEPYPMRNLFIIIKINEITRFKENIKFANYKSMVEIDLNQKLLNKQFPIDLNDIKKKLNFKINHENMK